LQTSPDSFRNFRQRLGLTWSPGKNSRWVLAARSGLFTDNADPSMTTEVYRLNGSRQQETLVYSPSYTSPLTPVVGSIAVTTMNRFSPDFGQTPSLQFTANIEYGVPERWKIRAGMGVGTEWQYVRQIDHADGLETICRRSRRHPGPRHSGACSFVCGQDNHLLPANAIPQKFSAILAVNARGVT
jgi:hypothetical protein